MEPRLNSPIHLDKLAVHALLCPMPIPNCRGSKRS